MLEVQVKPRGYGQQLPPPPLPLMPTAAQSYQTRPTSSNVRPEVNPVNISCAFGLCQSVCLWTLFVACVTPWRSTGVIWRVWTGPTLLELSSIIQPTNKGALPNLTRRGGPGKAGYPQQQEPDSAVCQIDDALSALTQAARGHTMARRTNPSPASATAKPGLLKGVELFLRDVRHVDSTTCKEATVNGSARPLCRSRILKRHECL